MGEGEHVAACVAAPRPPRDRRAPRPRRPTRPRARRRATTTIPVAAPGSPRWSDPRTRRSPTPAGRRRPRPARRTRRARRSGGPARSGLVSTTAKRWPASRRPSSRGLVPTLVEQREVGAARVPARPAPLGGAVADDHQPGPGPRPAAPRAGCRRPRRRRGPGLGGIGPEDHGGQSATRAGHAGRSQIRTRPGTARAGQEWRDVGPGMSGTTAVLFDADSLTRRRGTMANSTSTHDGIRLFLDDLDRYPLPDHEEQVELAKRVAAGDDEARRQMIAANLRLVVHWARRYQDRGVDFGDLVQEGTFGLMRAVDKFDWQRGFRFSTYATWWIRQALQRAVQQHGNTIRVPMEVAEQAQRADRVTLGARRRPAARPHPRGGRRGERRRQPAPSSRPGRGPRRGQPRPARRHRQRHRPGRPGRRRRAHASRTTSSGRWCSTGCATPSTRLGGARARRPAHPLRARRRHAHVAAGHRRHVSASACAGPARPRPGRCSTWPPWPRSRRPTRPPDARAVSAGSGAAQHRHQPGAEIGGQRRLPRRAAARGWSSDSRKAWRNSRPAPASRP